MLCYFNTAFSRRDLLTLAFDSLISKALLVRLINTHEVPVATLEYVTGYGDLMTVRILTLQLYKSLSCIWWEQNFHKV